MLQVYSLSMATGQYQGTQYVGSVCVVYRWFVIYTYMYICICLYMYSIVYRGSTWVLCRKCITTIQKSMQYMKLGCICFSKYWEYRGNINGVYRYDTGVTMSLYDSIREHIGSTVVQCIGSGSRWKWNQNGQNAARKYEARAQECCKKGSGPVFWGPSLWFIYTMYT